MAVRTRLGTLTPRPRNPRRSRGALVARGGRMLRVFTSVTILLGLATRPAAADCNEYDPTPVSAAIPLGCPLVVFVHPNQATMFLTKLVRALPDGTRVDAMASVAVSHRELDVQLEMCDQATESVDYTTFTATGYTANVGERLLFGNARPVLLTEPGPCPAVSEPVFSCECTPQDYYDDHCNAGHG